MKYFLAFLIVVSCTQKNPVVATEPSFANQGVGIVTSDYSTGELLLVWPGKSIVKVPIHPDAKVIVPDLRSDDLVIVGRHHRDSLQFVDRFSGVVRGEQSVGLGTNAQDALFVTSEIVYATRYERNSIWVGKIDASYQFQGSQELSFPSIEADSNGPAEVYSIVQLGKFVLVSVQNLSDAFLPAGKSKVVVLDVSDPWVPEEISQVMLVCQNPVTDFVKLKESDGAFSLLIGGAGEMGFYSKLDGCVERLELSAEGSLTTAGAVVTETELGGDIIALRLVGDDTGLALVAASDKNSTARLFSVSGKRVTQPIGNFTGRSSDILSLGNTVLVSVADLLKPSVSAFDLNGEGRARPFTLPEDLLPPQQMVLLGKAQ